jgi:hypothetical protein
MFSSKRLLELAPLSSITSVDGTHKLIYEGYPIIVVGNIDQSKTFHPNGFVFTTSEDELAIAFTYNTIKKYLKDKKGKKILS